MKLLVAALATLSAGAPAPPAAPTSGPVDAAGVREHLAALQAIADASAGTRAAGTPGDARSVAYVTARLRAAGWRVRRQAVAFPFFAEGPPARVEGVRRGRDFRILRFSGAGTFTGRVRPLDTPGCRASELGRLRDSDVVLLPRGTCTFRAKAQSVERAGGGALIVVDRTRRRPFTGTLDRPGVRIPVLSASASAGARLVRRGTVDLRVETVSEQRRTSNVVAETPGTTARGRVVMAGAHLDSVAQGPGINDNGSGVAALLEIAERLAGSPGVRLGFWGAEEIGLLGSRRYVRGLDRAERRALAVYVNLDMVGSPNGRPAVYDTDDRVERVLRAARPGDESETDVGGASDQAPFERAGIAVGGYFTGAQERVNGRASDPCYHRACDTLANVDAQSAAALARATQRALLALRVR